VIAPPYTRHLDAAVDPADRRALGDMAREVEAIVQGILDRRPRWAGPRSGRDAS